MIQSSSTSTYTSPFRALSRPVLAAAHRAIAVIALLLTLMLAAPVRAQGGCPAAWVPGIGTPGPDFFVSTLVVLPSGDLLVGGEFSNIVGVPVHSLARYNPATGIWSPLGSGTDGRVQALAVLPGGDVIVGGSFSVAGGLAANNIARVNPLTNVWTALGSGVTPTLLGEVRALAILPSGDVIAGGLFETAGGVAGTNGIARYNPTSGIWSAMGTGINIDGAIFALAVLPGGDVIVGGSFTTAGGIAASRIARCNPTSGLWSAVGTGININGGVYALAVLPGGDVIVGGNFPTAGGVAARNIARCNPTTGIWSALGTGIIGNVNALLVLPGDDVIAGGSFNTAGGVAASRIARCNPTAGVWSALGVGVNSSIFAVAGLPGGDVIAGGGFTTAGGVTANNIARYFLGASAPSINTQPVPVATVASNSAVFYCGATAGIASTGTLTYQWRKGGVAINTVTNPSAATSVLALASVQAADLGSYACLVTNVCGSTLSSPAMLTFVTPPVSAACSLADVAGALNNGQPAPDGIVDGTDFIEFINAFAAGC